MVFFTCNACGAALKKNQVEKHWQNQCPNCAVLSCIDCGRDFYGDEYAGHTKCITEAEKYQGPLCKESARGLGKGEKKQQDWLEQVKHAVSGAKVSPRVARLLERIADYPNVPRKRTKFENFVRNSFHTHDQRTLSELWEAFSGAVQQPSADTPTKSCQHSGDKHADSAVVAPVVTMATKRKLKVVESDPLNGVQTTPDCNGDIKADKDGSGCTESSDAETPKLKKKKKKGKSHEAAEAMEEHSEREAETSLREVEEDTNDAPKKKKKKKHKHKAEKERSEDSVLAMSASTSTNHEGTVVLATASDSESQGVSTKSRKRSGKVEESDLEEEREPRTEGGAKSRKKRSRKVKESDLEEEEREPGTEGRGQPGRKSPTDMDDAESELGKSTKKRKKRKHETEESDIVTKRQKANACVAEEEVNWPMVATVDVSKKKHKHKKSK